MLDFNGTLAQDDPWSPSAGTGLIRARLEGYDPASGIAELVIEGLDPDALAPLLALGSFRSG